MSGADKPIGRTTAFFAIRDTTWVVFRRLGVLSGRHREVAPTPSAVVLARAALLHEEPPTSVKRVAPVELAVALLDVDPPVERRVVVPDRATLADLHGLLQSAMGWQDAHLWQFELDGVGYGDVEDLDDLENPRSVPVASIRDGTAFRYVYDFGDGWEHDIRVVDHRTAEAPACLDGARACPPEDCGGAPGYERLLRVLPDPGHPERAELLDWLGGPLDPEAFDAAEATRRMRRPRTGRRS